METKSIHSTTVSPEQSHIWKKEALENVYSTSPPSVPQQLPFEAGYKREELGWVRASYKRVSDSLHSHTRRGNEEVDVM